MKKRFTLPFLFAAFVGSSAPAHADILTGLLVEATSSLLSKGVQAVVASAKEIVVPKETAEDRKVRENAEIEKAADQILSQLPEEEREAKKPEVMAGLTKVYVQHQTMEARQMAIRAEQNSYGNIFASAAKSAISHRAVSDSAAFSAFSRWR